jgi:L-threonylcarbamoyladenylate synthase
MAERRAVDLAHPDEASLARAVDVLHAEGVVVYPTETLYGIGVDPRSEAALVRLQQAKRRMEVKPVLLIIPSLEAARPLIAGVSERAALLAGAFWPGPLTLLFEASSAVSPRLTAGTGRIGLRVPASDLCMRLVALFGYPITSTSANRTGEPTPAGIDGIKAMLDPFVDLYLDGGALPHTSPSTVVDVTGSRSRVIREGALSLARLRSVVPDITL